MNNESRKKELSIALEAARYELYEIEQAETYAKNKTMVGKCFKYPRNCYSCPQKESDYWPVYYKVVKVTKSRVRCIVFSTDRDGKIEIERDARFLNSGTVPIPNAEFNRALTKLKKTIHGIGK